MGKVPLWFAAAGLAAAVLSISEAAWSAPGTTTLPEDLARALEAYNLATMRNDTEQLSTLVTDDYLLINSDTSIQDKQSYLADFRVPGFAVDPYVIEQPFYRPLGDAALTGGVFRLGWSQAGQRFSRHLRITHVWVKKDGRWRISYTQLTRVPE